MTLGLVVVLAVTESCVPIVLRNMDAAIASRIFLSGTTDVVSMGLLLILASLLMLQRTRS